MPERDLHLEVTTDADSSGLAKAAKDTATLRDEVKSLGAQMDTTRKGSDRFGASLEDTTRDARTLEAQIERTRIRVRDLGTEYVRTGDKSLFKDLRSERAALRELESINREMQSLGSQMEITRRGTDRLGLSFTDAAGDARTLEAQLERARTSLKQLSVEYLRTGDTRLLDNIGREQSTLRELEKIKKELLAIGAIETLGTRGGGIGKGLAEALGALPSQLRGSAIAAAVGIGALMAPPIGGAVGGAVIGAVGTGGIAGGIFAASKDSGVRAAAREFGQSISGQFFDSGDAFVKPTKDALATLQKTFGELKLGDTFARSSAGVSLLTEAIAGFARESMPGLNRAMDASTKIMGVMERELPQLGEAFSDMLTEISKSDGVVGGFQFLMDALEGTLRITGNTVSWLGDRFEDMATINVAVGGTLEGLVGDVPILGDKIRDLTRHNQDFLQAMHGYPIEGEGMKRVLKDLGVKTGDFAGYLQDARDSARDLNVELGKLFDTDLDVDKANIAMKKGILELKESLKENRGAWSENTEAGLAHREMVLRTIEDAQRWRDSLVKDGMATDIANKKYMEQVKLIEGIAYAAGITKTELDKLVGKYEVAITFTANTSQLPKLKLNNLYLLGGEAGAGGKAPAPTGLTSMTTTNLHAHQQIPALDDGGTVTKAGIADVHRQERVFLPTGASVVPLKKDSGGGFEVRFGGNLDSVFAAAFMKLVRGGHITIARKAVV